MAATPERERIYECEVKRRRVRKAGGYEPFWKVKEIAVALIDEDTEFRCKECSGAVKLVKRTVGGVSSAHLEHKHRGDSEYCLAGLHFKKATDGREHRASAHPVQ